jgi:hypothetical protein
VNLETELNCENAGRAPARVVTRALDASRLMLREVGR